MTDQEAREFVEMLAVPESTDPPPCPVCGHTHPLETGCVLPSRDDAPQPQGPGGSGQGRNLSSFTSAPPDSVTPSSPRP
jgi:hypothetical protein